jgi:hypothetical protein
MREPPELETGARTSAQRHINIYIHVYKRGLIFSRLSRASGARIIAAEIEIILVGSTDTPWPLLAAEKSNDNH